MEYLLDNMFVIVSAIFFILFVTSLIRDRRRFRNSIYLLFFILSLIIDMLVTFQETGTGSLLTVLLVVFLFFMGLVVPLLLFANGYVILKKERFSLSNSLSILYACFILAGEAAFIFAIVHRHAFASPWPPIVLFTFGWIVLYVSIVFLAFMLYSAVVQIIPRRVDVDYVIILGCGLINGNQVSKLLSERIEKAIRIYEMSLSSVKLVCSGGQGPGESISEAEAMMKYLIDRGIPQADILIENQSTSTMENLRNSQMLIRSRGGRQYTCLVTSNYHVLRAMIYAKNLNFPLEGSGAHVAAYYWPSAITREYAAMVRYFAKPYILGFLVTLLTGLIYYLHWAFGN